MASPRIPVYLMTLLLLGIAGVGTASAAPRIVGGDPIEIQSAPWTVFVQDRTATPRLLCTGSILDPTHVLTAAHCVYDETGTLAAPSALSVEAGVSDFNTPLASDVEQDSSVSAIRVHPRYVWSAKSAPDDVAVLTLASPLDLSGPAAQAVRLPTLNAPFPNGAAVGLAGFGRQTPAATATGPIAWMTGTVDDQGTCGGPSGVSLIDDNAVILCASSPAATACKGDSGAGLVTLRTHTLVGVVSTGFSCTPASHTIYTYVAAGEILSFIEGVQAPPPAPREWGTTFLDLTWTPPLVVGNTLGCRSGNWRGSPALSYAFVDAFSGTILQSGSNRAYHLRASDAGRRIFCRVTASDGGGAMIDETGSSPTVDPPPTARILPVTAVAARRGITAAIRISLHAPSGLWGRFSVCVAAPHPVGGRACASTSNPKGAPGTFRFTIPLRIRSTAPLGTARLTVTATAGVATATAVAVLRVES